MNELPVANGSTTASSSSTDTGGYLVPVYLMYELHCDSCQLVQALRYPYTDRMSRNDVPLWYGPDCPQCGTELDVEPVSTESGIRIAYSCHIHGLVSIASPFDQA